MSYILDAFKADQERNHSTPTVHSIHARRAFSRRRVAALALPVRYCY
jgi:hypothetical protein